MRKCKTFSKSSNLHIFPEQIQGAINMLYLKFSKLEKQQKHMAYLEGFPLFLSKRYFLE